MVRMDVAFNISCDSLLEALDKVLNCGTSVKQTNVSMDERGNVSSALHLSLRTLLVERAPIFLSGGKCKERNSPFICWQSFFFIPAPSTWRLPSLVFSKICCSVLECPHSKYLQIFYSNLFTIPKPNVRIHILVFKALNVLIQTQKFSIESTQSVILFLHQEFYFSSGY